MPLFKIEIGTGQGTRLRIETSAVIASQATEAFRSVTQLAADIGRNFGSLLDASRRRSVLLPGTEQQIDLFESGIASAVAGLEPDQGSITGDVSITVSEFSDYNRAARTVTLDPRIYIGGSKTKPRG